MKKLHAFYFSGTGNTLYVIKKLCGLLKERYECRLYDVSKHIEKKAVQSADLIAFAYPVYGSAPPIPMRKFFAEHKGEFKGKETIIACTQYFFSSDGAASLGRALNKCGAFVTYAEHFNMPNNLSDCKIFKIKNGEENCGRLRKTDAKIQAFANRILSKRPFLRGFGVISHAVGFLSQRALYRKHENDKRGLVKIAENCVGCGACARLCPVGNLNMQGGRPVPQNGCVLCYRCVNICPKKAISILGKSPPSVQYKGITPT